MGKIISKFRNISLKWCFVIYLPICLFFSFAGSTCIGISINYLQSSFMENHSILVNDTTRTEVRYDIEGNADEVIVPRSYAFTSDLDELLYDSINVVQIIVIPLWVLLCICVTSLLFYKKELKKPFQILTEASNKISENNLDFSISYSSGNELGKLCESFEQMRESLYQNNITLWHSLEERKRLNSAFSHDLRTPLTVLRGYSDLLSKYIPEGKVTEEKLLNIVYCMNGNILRLERYVQSMNSVQKLEDIQPDLKEYPLPDLLNELNEIGRLLCVNKQYLFNTAPTQLAAVTLDKDLLFQVYENLLTNAIRYADQKVQVACCAAFGFFRIQITDDGSGFSEQALRSAAQPFYREEKETDTLHFGLGLYISRIICEKMGGSLQVENHFTSGGQVTANFLL